MMAPDALRQAVLPWACLYRADGTVLLLFQRIPRALLLDRHTIFLTGRRARN
jgi:hypothetical protein